MLSFHDTVWFSLVFMDWKEVGGAHLCSTCLPEHAISFSKDSPHVLMSSSDGLTETKEQNMSTDKTRTHRSNGGDQHVEKRICCSYDTIHKILSFLKDPFLTKATLDLCRQLFQDHIAPILHFSKMRSRNFVLLAFPGVFFQ